MNEAKQAPPSPELSTSPGDTTPASPSLEQPTSVGSSKQSGSGQPEKRPLSIWIRFLRGLLIVLILFGFGALLVLFTLYLPARTSLSEANKRLIQFSSKSATDMEAANQKIDSLSSLETANKELKAELDQARLEPELLRARLDVATALLALANKDPGGAKTALAKTPDTLKALQNLLPQDKQGRVNDMLSRLKLVLAELDKDDYAAQSDLDVLANMLLDLENTFTQ